MYLNRLNKEQKELFIDICIHAALANNEFAEKEKEIIRQYFDEMQLTETRFTANLDLESAVSKLIEISSHEELKMVALEITALIISDHQFDDLENKFMSDFIDRIQMSREEFDEMCTLLKDLTTVYEKINCFVFNKSEQ